MSSVATNEQIYRSLCALLQLDVDNVQVDLLGNDPVLPSPHRITDACSVALACAGAAMVRLAQHRGGQADSVTVDSHSSSLQLSAAFYTSLNGVSVTRLFDDARLFTESDFYATRDGGWVFLLLTYPHLRDVACEVLNCAPGREKYGEAIAKWDAKTLEREICDRRGCCYAVRTKDEWRASEQGKALLGQPLVRIQTRPTNAAPPPTPLPPTTELPLHGVRILDNTHVIAGPMLARMAAEHGADVLRISSPEHGDPAAMLNETGLGKRNAFCDLHHDADVAALWAALESTDVYVCSYRGMHRKGLSPDELLRRRPSLIVVEITAWGDEGPWAQADWGGFDQLACTATGFSALEGGGGDGGDGNKPSLPPTYLLNDYLAAIIALAAVGGALLRRAVDGGGHVIRINLASVVMWVQDLGTFDPGQYAHLPPLQRPLSPADAHRLSTVKGPNGTATYLPTCIRYAAMRPHFRVGAEPSGASLLSWDV